MPKVVLHIVPIVKALCETLGLWAQSNFTTHLYNTYFSTFVFISHLFVNFSQWCTRMGLCYVGSLVEHPQESGWKEFLLFFHPSQGKFPSRLSYMHICL